MARAFTAADVKDHGQNTSSATDEVIPSLTRQAVAGRGGVLVILSQQSLYRPYGWHRAQAAGIAAGVSNLLIAVRPCLLGSDQSWQFVASTLPLTEGDHGNVAYWVWMAEEWQNISYGPPLPGSHTDGQWQPGSPTLAISTGNSGSFSGVPYVAGIAAVGMLGSAGSDGWPTGCSWSNGFTETDVISIGTGTAATDLHLRVARRYGTLNDAGPWSTTATFSGSGMNGLSVFAALAVLRGEYRVGDI